MPGRHSWTVFILLSMFAHGTSVSVILEDNLVILTIIKVSGVVNIPDGLNLTELVFFIILFWIKPIIVRHFLFLFHLTNYADFQIKN